MRKTKRKSDISKRRGPDEDKWAPIDRWMQENGGSVPEKELFIFDDGGNNVALADVKCRRTYYAMYREIAAVRRCPAALALRRLVAKTKLRALTAANRVANRCRHEPGCAASITLQVHVSRCMQIGGEFDVKRHEIDSGHVYRIDCVEV